MIHTSGASICGAGGGAIAVWGLRIYIAGLCGFTTYLIDGITTNIGLVVANFTSLASGIQNAIVVITIHKTIVVIISLIITNFNILIVGIVRIIDII